MLLYPNLTPHSPAPRCTLARRSRAQTDRQPDRQSRGHLLQLLIRAAAPPAAATAAAAAAKAAAAAVAALDGGVPLRQLHHLRLYIVWCNKYNGTIRRIKLPFMRVSRSGSSTTCGCISFDIIHMMIIQDESNSPWCGCPAPAAPLAAHKETSGRWRRKQPLTRVSLPNKLQTIPQRCISFIAHKGTWGRWRGPDPVPLISSAIPGVHWRRCTTRGLCPSST